MKYKAMLKSELAAQAGVSRRTFARWLLAHRKQLKKLGVTERSRLLQPSAVKYICETFAIDL